VGESESRREECKQGDIENNREGDRGMVATLIVIKWILRIFWGIVGIMVVDMSLRDMMKGRIKFDYIGLLMVLLIVLTIALI
jgi:hypothetical protein